MLPNEVRRAFEEVRKFFPNVDHVFFSADGRWFFTDGAFSTFDFYGTEIDTGYLEDAADSIDNKGELPAAFVYEPHNEYADLPSHTKHALDMWAREGRMAGHFVTAVLENDLMKAMSHADTTNRNAIDVITKYVYNHLPSGCWGSPERVQAWHDSFAEEKEHAS